MIVPALVNAAVAALEVTPVAAIAVGAAVIGMTAAAAAGAEHEEQL